MQKHNFWGYQVEIDEKATADWYAVHHFATKALKLVPENVKAQYWLVYAIYHSGVITLAKKEIQQAKSRLTAEEFETLQKFICKDESLPYGQLFD